MKGFEIIESGSNLPEKPQQTVQTAQQSKEPTAMGILSDNFDTILKLAGDVIEIKKMKVASDACLAKMEQDRKMLLDEAYAYAMKKKADTSSVVERMNVIRLMMQDFYAHSNGNLSGDDFCKIITEVVNQMGKIENGIR
jgi:hypothetical protein